METNVEKMLTKIKNKNEITLFANIIIWSVVSVTGFVWYDIETSVFWSYVYAFNFIGGTCLLMRSVLVKYIWNLLNDD